MKKSTLTSGIAMMALATASFAQVKIGTNPTTFDPANKPVR
jgi:hypothetical protein